jgi:hypothetical protein
MCIGSVARGVADAFSDLDLVLWVRGERPPERFRALLGQLGEVRFWYARGPTLATGFVGDAWHRVDLHLLLRDELRPDAAHAGAKVLADTDAVLAALVEASHERVSTSADRVRGAIEEAIDSQIYLARHCARGAVWSATGELAYRCAELYTVLARLRGRESHGFRFVEGLLTADEQALLARCWPAPDAASVRSAARALWTFTRRVWDEAERRCGPLGVTVDEPALLAAVDRIHEGRVG